MLNNTKRTLACQKLVFALILSTIKTLPLGVQKSIWKGHIAVGQCRLEDNFFSVG